MTSKKLFASKALPLAIMLGAGLGLYQPTVVGAQAPPSPAQSHPVQNIGRPNVILIVADDLGYSDLGAFGSEIRTPNLDRLAHQGLILTEFYTAPTCSPTRSMLLSGRDNHEVGLGTMIEVRTPNQVGKPGYEGYLSRSVDSLPAALDRSGYQTFMTGKWHLGMDEDHSPKAFGFDRSFALLQGVGNHFGADQDGEYARAGRVALYRENGSLTRFPVGQFSADYYTDRMIEFLRESDPEKPIFAYLAYTAPHWPLQAPREDIARYKGQYDAGPAALHATRLARMKAIGMASVTAEAGRYPFPEWAKLSAEKRATEARKMEIFAGMVDRMDQNVGRLIAALRESGRLNNTVIIFISDNGPDGLDLSAPLDPMDPTKSTETNIDNSLDNMGNASSYVSYGPEWAHASSAPFAGIKASTAEGGIRVPAFIWGAGVTGGRLSRQTLHVTDIYPTIMDITGSHSKDPLEGLSWKTLLSTKTSASWSAQRKLNWELFDRRAARDGKWKALYVSTKMAALKGRDDRQTVKWELYDIHADPGETKDLSSKYPLILKRLVTQWNAYAHHVGLVEIQQVDQTVAGAVDKEKE